MGSLSVVWYGRAASRRSMDPRRDSVPQEILGMVQLAREKYGIGLLAYVYPCLAFEALAGTPAMADRTSGYNPIDLGTPQAQNYLIGVLGAFMEKTGASGFAWDHDIFTSAATGGTGHYAQWRGWMRILKVLREAHPDMVMDHRQTAHAWGPGITWRDRMRSQSQGMKTQKRTAFQSRACTLTTSQLIICASSIVSMRPSSCSPFAHSWLHLPPDGTDLRQQHRCVLWGRAGVLGYERQRL